MSSIAADELRTMIADDLRAAKAHLSLTGATVKMEAGKSTDRRIMRARCADAHTNHARLCFEMLQAMT